MTITFRTETGSTYILNKEEMTWTRISEDSNIRGKSGPLHTWPKIEIGRSAVLVGPPLKEDMDIRIITTSPVITIANGV